MPTISLYKNDRQYTVELNDKGVPVAYAVRVDARGKRPTDRWLWSVQRHGLINGDIPQGLKDLLNVRGACEAIARAMSW